MKILRTIALLVCAVSLAYLAGWALPGDGLALPAGIASAGSLLLALSP
jgi:hypothetical protein